VVDRDGKLGTQGFDGTKMMLPGPPSGHPQPMSNEFRGKVEELKAWITKLDSRSVRQEAVIAEQRKQLEILATNSKSKPRKFKGNRPGQNEQASSGCSWQRSVKREQQIRSKSMKTIIPRSKTPAGRLCSAFGVILIAFALSVLALAQKAQALSPAPDGGYPGLNTAEGQNALLGLTTGTANTAVGWFSLKSNTDGTFNTAVGAATLLSNVGNQSTGEGVNNTAIGAAALLFNTTGFDNTAVGAAALLHNIAVASTRPLENHGRRQHGYWRKCPS
jgi:hypothetical protein